MLEREDMKWRKYKEFAGVRYMGKHRFNPAPPWTRWDKIIGVVARCEGNMDTVVSYDGTGVTFGFQQWTFTSGRLQKLLQSFKSVPVHMEEEGDIHENPYDTAFSEFLMDNEGTQLFEKFGFRIQEGKIFSLESMQYLDPRKDKQKIRDLCMGRVRFPGAIRKQRDFAKDLAIIFGELGTRLEVQQAQAHFAKAELQRMMNAKRKVLGDFGTMHNMIPSTEAAWELPIAALFLNLYQNSPRGAFRLMQNVWKDAVRSGIASEDVAQKYPMLGESREYDFLKTLWTRVNRTKFANWGWQSSRYLAGKGNPRITRIRPALNEFYGINLPFEKG